jgi:integrase
MKDTISRGFAQYIKQVTDRPLTFKCLRKTYITGISLYLGGNAKAITGHSTDAVIEGHYLVKEELARKAKGLSVFGVIRNEELKEIRTNSINHQTMEVEK